MGFVWVEEKEDDAKFTAHLDTKIGEATTTLTNTNSGLLGDIKKLKKQVKDKEGFDITEFNTLKTENEALKKAKQEGETDAEKQLRLAREQHSAEVTVLKKRLDKKDENDDKNLISAQVSSSLAVIQVKPSLLNAAKRIIKGDVTIEDVDGERVPMVGDQTVAEYAATWAKTDEGKNFVLAKKNKGGDSDGGDGDGGDEDDAKFFKKGDAAYNVTKQILLKKSNPARYKELSAKSSK